MADRPPAGECQSHRLRECGELPGSVEVGEVRGVGPSEGESDPSDGELFPRAGKGRSLVCILSEAGERWVTSRRRHHQKDLGVKSELRWEGKGENGNDCKLSEGRSES